MAPETILRLAQKRFFEPWKSDARAFLTAVFGPLWSLSPFTVVVSVFSLVLLGSFGVENERYSARSFLGTWRSGDKSLPFRFPSCLVPVKTYGDGNCLFRAVAQCVYGEKDHAALRAETMEELRKNKQQYALEVIERAKSAASRSPLSTLSLLQSILSDSNMALLERERGKRFLLEDAMELAVEREAGEGKKSGTYGSLLQAMALSTVNGRAVVLVYPNVNGSLRAFLNTTLSPLVEATPKHAHISRDMVSCHVVCPQWPKYHCVWLVSREFIGLFRVAVWYEVFMSFVSKMQKL